MAETDVDEIARQQRGVEELSLSIHCYILQGRDQSVYKGITKKYTKNPNGLNALVTRRDNGDIPSGNLRFKVIIRIINEFELRKRHSLCGLIIKL